MDDDQRTVWCGNLSEKVTEDILYELFLQGGPVRKVSIPKDRDGKQRTFGFVTFKHEISVPYVLELFQGTTLFDRILTIKTRNNIEQPQLQYNPMNINQTRYQDHFQFVQDYQNMYQLPDPRLINNIMPNLTMLDFTFDQNLSNALNNRLDERLVGPSRRNHIEGKSPHGGHPYPRDRDRDKNGQRDRNVRRERHSSHRSHDNHRDSSNRNSNRNNYRQT